MALTLGDHERLLSGFTRAGYSLIVKPQAASNPIHLTCASGSESRRFRLWTFEITHGGGGSAVRAADEFRIQITNGPERRRQLDSGDVTDLLLGYSRDRNAVVAYDRRWLEAWVRKREEDPASRGSPSVQVKAGDIQKGHDNGFHRLTKNVEFGVASIVTMNPDYLPTYLLNHEAILTGTMTAASAPKNSRAPLTVAHYCHSHGFPFDPDLIARYLASLLSKPFVILAGVSGTGKSKLSELVAEFYTRDTTMRTGSAPVVAATLSVGDHFEFASGPSASEGADRPDPTRFALVAVRPDWVDNQAIFGFLNPITSRYESTAALDLMLRAKQSLVAAQDQLAAPRYFMLLDEMNLARVEHYFSDWLACAESRRALPSGQVTQRPVALHRHDSRLETTLPDGTQLQVPAEFALPTNVVVTGTVNVDETTFGFSPKVLDRAMVIEFDEVDLSRLRDIRGTVDLRGYRLPESLPAFRLATGQDYAALPKGAHDRISTINEILKRARLHVGYRAANEIALFMTLYSQMLPEDLSDPDMTAALDVAVLQKVLPRVSGNRAKVEPALIALCAYLRDLKVPKDDESAGEFVPGAAAALPRAYARAIEMLETLRSFGFVTFFK